MRIHRAIHATTFATSIALVGGVWLMAARTHVTLIIGGHAESISKSCLRQAPLNAGLS